MQEFSPASLNLIQLISETLKDGNPKNNLGAQPGFNGTLIMSDEQFNEYMFRLVVDKKYVPTKVLDVLNQKPIMLPAWDPMFSPEE